MTAASFARRYCLLFYWFLLAAMTARDAQFPGLMLHPEQWRYPWRAVLVVWALLAILVGILQIILHPVSYHRSWARLVGALLYAAVLLVLADFSMMTDMPGYYYAPAQFAVVTTAGLLIFASFQALCALWRRWRRAA